jgi:hypothetical protein
MKYLLTALIFAMLLTSPSISYAYSGDTDLTDVKAEELEEQPSEITSGYDEEESAAEKDSILDTIEKLLRIAAYIVGALWVYYNFFKGRTYRPRLEININGNLSESKSRRLINLKVKVKNVGLSKVKIYQRGTGLRLLKFNPTLSEDPWEHMFTETIFEDHGWIEPGETINEPFLFPLDNSDIMAVKAEVIIVSKKTMWKTATIFTQKKED